MTLQFIDEKSLPNYIALSSDIEDNGTITGASLIGGKIYLLDTGTWKIILPNLKLIPYSFSNGTAGVAPTYVSGEIGTVNTETVAITFSENIVALNYSAGVTIKVNGTSVSISSSIRQINHAIVYYSIPTVIAGDIITWEYNELSGGISSETGTVYLADVSPQTVTNNVA